MVGNNQDYSGYFAYYPEKYQENTGYLAIIWIITDILHIIRKIIRKIPVIWLLPGLFRIFCLSSGKLSGKSQLFGYYTDYSGYFAYYLENYPENPGYLAIIRIIPDI